MDWLSEQILEFLRLDGFDPAYLESKKSELEDKDRFEVVIWCGRLDSEKLRGLADYLGVPFEDLEATVRTVKKL